MILLAPKSLISPKVQTLRVNPKAKLAEAAWAAKVAWVAKVA